jgi:hypothetical protein
MTTQQSQDHEKLDALAQQFVQWRQTRSSLSVKIPERLLEQALALAETHPNKSAVLKKLRINHTQLKRYQQSTMSGAVQHAAVKFVQLPAQARSLANTPTVQLIRQDGHKMTISELSMEQLSQLVSSFMQPAIEKVSSCCS